MLPAEQCAAQVKSVPAAVVEGQQRPEIINPCFWRLSFPLSCLSLPSLWPEVWSALFSIFHCVCNVHACMSECVCVCVVSESGIPAFEFAGLQFSCHAAFQALWLLLWALQYTQHAPPPVIPFINFTLLLLNVSRKLPVSLFSFYFQQYLKPFIMENFRHTKK